MSGPYHRLNVPLNSSNESPTFLPNVLAEASKLGFAYFMGVMALFCHVAITSLVAKKISPDPRLNTLPLSAIIAASALVVWPAGLAMRRWGYKKIFVCGIVVGTLGGLICAWAVYISSFAALTGGCALHGVSYGIVHYYRHVAASELGRSGRRDLVIAMVVSGGVLAGIAGPGVALLVNWLIPAHAFEVTYLVIAGKNVLHLLLIMCVRLPDSSASSSSNELLPKARPLLKVVRQPSYLRSLFGATTAHFVMSGLMAVTPLYIGGDQAFGKAAVALQIHVVCMYAPSLLTPKLIGSLGHNWVIALGLLICGAGSGVMYLSSFAAVAVGLAVVGVGWNLAFVGGTSLLASCYQQTEQITAQAFNDTFVFFWGASVSLTAGVVLHTVRWEGLCIGGGVISCVALLLHALSLCSFTEEPVGNKGPHDSGNCRETIGDHAVCFSPCPLLHTVLDSASLGAFASLALTRVGAEWLMVTRHYQPEAQVMFTWQQHDHLEMISTVPQDCPLPKHQRQQLFQILRGSTSGIFKFSEKRFFSVFLGGEGRQVAVTFALVGSDDVNDVEDANKKFISAGVSSGVRIRVATTAAVTLVRLLDLVSEVCVDAPGRPSTAENLVVSEVISLFEKHLGLTCEEDGSPLLGWVKVGREAFGRTAQYYVTRGKPIVFVLLGFPCKSSSKGKVAGIGPDKGEWAALKRLEEFMQSVSSVYAPGGRLVIMSDGRVYNDILQIPDHHVGSYRSQVRTLGQPRFLLWTSLSDFLPPTSSFLVLRQQLTDLFASPALPLAQKLQNDEDFNRVHQKFVEFLREEEHEVGIRSSLSLPERAEQMIMRNDAYSAFAATMLPRAIRLSIHPSSCTTKFSVQLVKGSSATPWHRVGYLTENGNWGLIRRDQAEAKGCTLCCDPSDGLSFYRQPRQDVIPSSLLPSSSPSCPSAAPSRNVTDNPFCVDSSESSAVTEAREKYGADIVFNQDTAIDNVLQTVGGNNPTVDRVYLFWVLAERMANSHEFCKRSQGIESNLERCKSIPINGMPYINSLLRKFEPFSLSIPQDLQMEEAKNELAEFTDQGIQCMMVQPIVVVDSEKKQKLIGFLGMEQVKTNVPWTEQQKQQLKVAGEVIAAVTAITETDSKQLSHPSFTLKNPDTGIARVIMERFEEIRRLPGPTVDRWATEGAENFVAQLRWFMSQGKPIPFVLPAFPCKSSNTLSKVTGVLPDQAEELALRNLKSFALDIQRVYKPGVRLVIVNDGRVFADVVAVPDDNVTDYCKAMRALAGSDGILAWIGLDDFLPVYLNLSFDEMRQRLEDLYGRPGVWVGEQIATDPNFKRTYLGFCKFLTVDLEESLTGLSRKQRRKKISDTAKKMMYRNEAFNKLIKDMFPHHIRLSIHPHPCVDKFGINLVDKQDADVAGTPWHNVAVKLISGGWTLMKKSLAEQLGYELVEEGLLYFQEIGTTSSI